MPVEPETTLVRPNASEEAAVLALYEQMMAGWNEGSGEAFAAPFSDEIDFIPFDGSHIQDRAEVAAGHQRLFDRWLKGTRLDGRATVRFLTPDVAVLVARGDTIMRGRSKPARERASMQTLVAQRTDGRWRLVTFQNTRIRPIGSAVGALLWMFTDRLWRLFLR